MPHEQPSQAKVGPESGSEGTISAAIAPVTEVERLNEPERRLLTVSGVAEATGLSANAVYRAIAAGELRASKLRGRLRVQLADLDAWIDSNVVCARGEDDWSAPPIEHLRAAGRGLRELLEADA